jgi:hypothetical protein
VEDSAEIAEAASLPPSSILDPPFSPYHEVMPFFDDLTPYAYFHPEPDPPGTVNVGWVDWGHPYPIGETAEAFRAKLRRLCVTNVRMTNGLYLCSMCFGPSRPTSSAEIRVPGKGGRVFAAPSLIAHYVDVHRYRPSEEFIEAVMALR